MRMDENGRAERTHYKKRRLGPQLLRASREPAFFAQVHVIFGGTGAVGGATALQMISLFEEAAGAQGAQGAHGGDRGERGGRAPHIVITGRTRQELRSFTELLFKVQERDHGALPEALERVGYRTVGGVIVE